MLTLKNDINSVRLITGFYFAIAAIEISAELFSFKPIPFIFKPLIALILIALYWITSNQKSLLFFVTIFFLLLANILFIPNSEKILFFGTVAFLTHQLLIVFYIIKLTKLKDCIPLFIAIIPFLFIFFYLFAISSEIPKNSYYVLIIQNILISIIGAIALSYYAMNDSKNNPWILIFGLLSVALYFIDFIGKYYLSDLAFSVFRLSAIILNTVVYYTFYRFVIETERLNLETDDLYNN